jgi:hypothetical protein
MAAFIKVASFMEYAPDTVFGQQLLECPPDAKRDEI